jgi:hypothetical protein
MQQNPVQENPNASVSFAVGAATIILVWIIQLLGLDVPEMVSQAITILGISLVLWAGKNKTSARAVAANNKARPLNEAERSTGP